MAITVARLVAPGGAVVGADISATMLALARARAAAEPGRDLTFVQADMQTDTVPGAPFDAAISQMGVMFFEDPVAAFANIRAHLRPGGRLAFACFQEMAKNRWWFAPVLAPYLPPPPPPSPGKHATGPFSLADAAATREILVGAGFADITHTPIEETVEAPESAVVDEPQLAFMGVPEGRRAEALEEVRAFMAQFRQPSGSSHFPTAVQVFTARNP